MSDDPVEIMGAAVRTMRRSYTKQRLVTPCCRKEPAFGWPRHACSCGQAWMMSELVPRGAR